MAYVQLQGSLQKSVLTFYHERPRNRTQAVSLGSKLLYRSHLTGPNMCLFAHSCAIGCETLSWRPEEALEGLEIPAAGTYSQEASL